MDEAAFEPSKEGFARAEPGFNRLCSRAVDRCGDTIGFDPVCSRSAVRLDNPVGFDGLCRRSATGIAITDSFNRVRSRGHTELDISDGFVLLCGQLHTGRVETGPSARKSPLRGFNRRSLPFSPDGRAGDRAFLGTRRRVS